MQKVTLIDYTKDAVDKLIYTKSTRLTQGEGTRFKIASMSPEEKDAELRYMATTIPSSWEFVTYTFEISGVSRAFTHQFVRTRTGSYAQQTQRMLAMERFTYVTGPTIKIDPLRRQMYDACMRQIQKTYDDLIKVGVSIEDARGVLPTNICTNIIAQFSLRTLSEMVKSRSGQRTQSEYREVVEKMQMAVAQVHPWTSYFLQPDRFKGLVALEQLVVNIVGDEGERVKFLKLIDALKKE